MRFTRPGARPRHRPCGWLDSTQLRGCVLGARVEDESAGAYLRTGEVLQLVACAIGRIELDVEVVMPAASPRRSLVHSHDVRKRPSKKAVVFLQQALQVASERLIVRSVEVGQPSAMSDRSEVNLVRPARECGDERDPALVSQHGPLAAALALDDVAVETPA